MGRADLKRSVRWNGRGNRRLGPLARILPVMMLCLLLVPSARAAIAVSSPMQPPHKETLEPWESPEWQAAVRKLDSCLAHPARSCALEAALLVTARQDLAIDRVDNLLALARSFIAMGDRDRARQLLQVAERTAAQIGIAIGTERKLAEIIPLYGLIADTENAERLLARLTDENRRAAAMARLAENLARAGKAEAALALVERITRPWLALDALDRVIRVLAQRDGGVPDALIDRFSQQIDRLPRYLLRDLARAHLALLLARKGERERAAAIAAELDRQLTGMGPAADELRLAAALTAVDLALKDETARNRHLQIILRRAPGLGPDEDRRRALAEAAVALALAGRMNAARDLLMEGVSDDYRLLLAVAQALLDADAPADLLATIGEHVVSAALTQSLRAERDRGRLVAIRLFVAAHRREPALETVRRIEDAGLRARGLAMLVPLLG
ncbi:MAG: hypothetical protein D6740_01080 [Alphaproteobacteria bacterium]|nr:MAG: hypothetical protein D6740_01080 [Alphaproteobacteria bacterium]